MTGLVLPERERVGWGADGSGRSMYGRVHRGASIRLPIAAIILLTRLVGRRCRDGRHLQLAGDALAAQPDLLHRLHGLRRVVLRRVRDHVARLDGQSRATATPTGAVCCGVFFMALTLVLVSFSCTGPDRRLGDHRRDGGRLLGSDPHDAGLLDHLRTALHALCDVSPRC